MKPRLLLTLAIGFSLAPEPLLACATCFGASDSKMAEGMNLGILTLLVVVACVLAGVGGFFLLLARRAAQIARSNGGRGGPAAVAPLKA